MTCRELVSSGEAAIEDHTSRGREIRQRLDAAGWNLAPTGRWSPAQIFEHLRLANEPYLHALPSAIQHAPTGDEAAIRTTWFGRTLLKMSGPDGNAPAPKPLIPGNGPFGEEPFAAWLGQQERLARLIAEAKGRNIGAVKIRNPFLKFARMTICDALLILFAHTERHLGQIEARIA